MSDGRFGVSPVNYPDPDPGWYGLIRFCSVVLFCIGFVWVS